MDCMSHTWHKAPSMRIARKWPLVSVLDGKIYVVEGCNGRGSSDLMEIFEIRKPKYGSKLPCPRAEILGHCSMLKSLAIDGKLYLFGDKVMVYNPKESKWDDVVFEKRFGLGTYASSCVIINNVVHSFRFCRSLEWYDDSEEGSWRDLKGLEELPKLPQSVMLVNYGGKMAVLWEKKVRGFGSAKKMIWCAVIAVERSNDQDVYGKIVWCEVVLTVPKSCLLFDI